MAEKFAWAHPTGSTGTDMAVRESVLRQRWWSVLLVLLTIQFTGAWLYPAAGLSVVENVLATKVGGTPYQTAMWGLIVLAFFIHSHRYGFDKLVRNLQLIAPFWIIGMLAAALGIDPIKSLRSLIMFALAVSGAALIGAELELRRVVRTLCWTFFFILLASAVLALAVPSIGTQIYGFTTVWRGAFTNKNQLGWVAALALLVVVCVMQRGYLRLPACTAALALACLLASGSKGALAAAVATLGYVYVVSRLSRYVSTGLGMAVIGFGIAVAAIFGFLVLPFILEAMGRDLTLTGRTDVWRIYFNAMSSTPWLGQGPTAYTTMSALTAPLAFQLQSLGVIVTPHNIFLGVFGDAGLFGLVAFLVPMVYLTAYLPLSRPGLPSNLCCAVGFLMLAHGMVETHEALAAGPGWFLLILFWSLAESGDAKPVVPAKPAESLRKINNGSLIRAVK